jgi:hypothetical protein
VLEAGEDCDGSPGCLAPPDAHACFFSCADDECPEGFVCGEDEVCRMPGFELEAPVTIASGDIVWSDARDLDGDGRDDLITVEGEPGQWVGTLEVRFFDASGAVEDLWQFPDVRSVPFLGDATGDGLDDILLSVGDTDWGETLQADPSVGGLVLRNTGERSFKPMAVSYDWGSRPNWVGLAQRSYHDFPSEQVGVKGVMRRGGWLEDAPLGASDTSEAVGPGAEPILNERLAVAFENLDQECARYAVVGGTKESGFEEDRYPGPVRVSGTHDCQSFALLPPNIYIGLPATGAAFLGALVFEDLNADGYADLAAAGIGPVEGGSQDQMVSTVWVAYGVADGSFHSDPETLPSVEGDGEFSAVGVAGQVNHVALIHNDLVAAGDLTRDGRPDFVFNNHIAISANCTDCACGGETDGSGFDCVQLSAEQETPPRIVDADIVDLDGDGEGELVALMASASGVGGVLRIMRWTGETFSSEEHFIGSTEFGGELSVQDLDNDGLADVAFRVDDGGQSHLLVLWGEADELVRVQEGLLFTPGVVAGREAVGGAARGDILTTVRQEEAEDVIGFVRFQHIGRRQLVAPFTLSVHDCEDDEGWILAGCRPRADITVVGSFRETGEPEVLLLGAAGVAGEQDSAISYPYQLLGGDLIRPVEANSTMLPGAIGRNWTNHQQVVVSDLDQDGVDEVLGLGLGPDDSGTRVIVYEPPAGGSPDWQAIEAGSLENITIRGPWPRAESPAEIESVDVDHDGMQDVLAVGIDPTSPDRRVAVLMHNGGMPVLHEELVDVKTFSFFGLAEDRGARFFAVTGDEVQVGEYDGAAAELTTVRSLAAPVGATNSAVGDFDGDRLPDVAVGTADGVILYRGAPTIGATGGGSSGTEG